MIYNSANQKSDVTLETYLYGIDYTLISNTSYNLSRIIYPTVTTNDPTETQLLNTK